MSRIALFQRFVESSTPAIVSQKMLITAFVNLYFATAFG